MTTLRLMTTVMAGQQAELAALEAAACHPPAEGSLWAQAAAWWTWGYACRTVGRLDEAQRAFAQMTRLGEKMENQWTTVTGHIDQGSVLRAQGRLSLALQTYQAGLDLVRGQTAFAPGFVGRLESLLAMVHYELNDLGQAHRLAEDSLRHNQGWRNPNHDTHAWLARALVALAEADAVQADRALEEAGQVVARGAVARLLQSSLEAVRVRYWLAVEDMESCPAVGRGSGAARREAGRDAGAGAVGPGPGLGRGRRERPGHAFAEHVGGCGTRGGWDDHAG